MIEKRVWDAASAREWSTRWSIDPPRTCNVISISDGREEAFVAVFINRLQALAVCPLGRARGQGFYSHSPAAADGGWNVCFVGDEARLVLVIPMASRRPCRDMLITKEERDYLDKAHTGIGLLPVPVVALHAAAGTDTRPLLMAKSGILYVWYMV